jgi:hypothetical protein
MAMKQKKVSKITIEDKLRRAGFVRKLEGWIDPVTQEKRLTLGCVWHRLMAREKDDLSHKMRRGTLVVKVPQILSMSLIGGYHVI